MIIKKQSIAFNGNKEDWDNFRLVCKLQDKNASVEVRKFINKYITANMDILIEFEAQQKQLKEEWLNDEN
jgi:hypothetical protein